MKAEREKLLQLAESRWPGKWSIEPFGQGLMLRRACDDIVGVTTQLLSAHPRYAARMLDAALRQLSPCQNCGHAMAAHDGGCEECHCAGYAFRFGVP